MTEAITALHINFDPLIPTIWLAGIIGAALVILVFSALFHKRGIILRTLATAAFILALLNPALLQEERKPVKDVAVIIVDNSPSQSFGERRARTDETLAYLQNELAGRDDLDLRVIYAPKDQSLTRETRIFGALDQALSDIPLKRRAGVIVLTDGQIHDLPKNTELYKQYGPFHALLSGNHREQDRQILLTQAPTYGIVGDTVQLKYKVIDSGFGAGKPTIAQVTINGFAQGEERRSVPVGEEQTLDLPITNAGQNIFQLSVDTLPNELTMANNKAALIVGGVRDRLKVLLVSGRPYTGGRTWRDLLTSDPGVDLVHFTILREPTKMDATPQKELSLIAFPFRELFEIKLYDFDLIIFDRYRLSRILPARYFENIARYVREGGGLLISSGPDFAGKDSLYTTALGSVLPAAPTDKLFQKSYKPALNDNGRIHPVTEELTTTSSWGPWLRQVGLSTGSGDTLMTGIDNAPLLILDRVAKGRVAQLASDHIWLWSRGYEGGGPATTLLRRIVHWLMKEPDLDETALDIEVDGSTIYLTSRNFNNDSAKIEMTKPGGATETILLEKGKDNLYPAKITAEELGIYGFENASGQKRFAMIGDLNPPELSAVITTEEPLTPIMNSSGGGAIWMMDHPRPNIRFREKTRNYAGSNWLALRQNNDFIVTGSKTIPLLPLWLTAFVLIALTTLAWWREGKQN